MTNIPEAKIKSKSSSISTIWVIPIIAALVGGWMVFKSAVDENLFAEVSFENAAGLEAGKTVVKLRNVKVGEVTEVKFSKDLSEVIVVMEFTGIDQEMLTNTTRFWVVKPRVGLEGVSGLDTLLSGAFIEIDPGEGGVPDNKFKGLKDPQIYQLGNPGTTYILTSPKLASLTLGSPVKFRDIKVGSITRYALVKDHSHVEIEIFIEAPHDQFVNKTSRFWNISGINFELGANGFKLGMDSVASVISGGVAFTNEHVINIDDAAMVDTVFQLHNTKDPDIEETLTFGAPMKLFFKNGVGGLSIGAPVKYKGIRLGTVVKVGVEASKTKKDIITFAMIDIEPERLPSDDLNDDLNKQQRIKLVYDYFEYMIQHGMRAQLTSNFITGQSSIVFDIFVNAKPQSVKYIDNYLVVPTVPETVAGLIKQVSDLLAKLQALPVEKIGKNLDEATVNLNDLIQSLNAEEGGMTGVQLNETMNELSKAVRSIRVMSEYLERHPEALIKGKPSE